MALTMLGLQKTSLIDYPGLISSVIFTPGCNMSCGYCHNAVLVRGSIPQDFLPREDVLAFLDTRKSMIKGVVITGGEPLLHEDLPCLIADLKALGFKIKLDTNGTLPDRLQQVRVDYIAMDYKLPASQYHRLGYRSDPKRILESVHFLRQGFVPHEFRLVWIADFHREEDIGPMAEDLGTGSRLFVTGFRPGGCLDPSFDTLSRPTPSRLADVVDRFRNLGVDAHLRA